MNKATKLTLLAIAVFVGGMVASFIWFVATWDKDAEQPVVLAPSKIIEIQPSGVSA